MSNTTFDYMLGELRTADKRPVMGGGGSSNSAVYARVRLGTDLPGDGFEGELFYDTDDAILYIYANGVWTELSGGTPALNGYWNDTTMTWNDTTGTWNET